MSVTIATLSFANEEESAFTLLQQICESSKAATDKQLEFSKLHENIMQLEGFIWSLDADEAGAAFVLESLSSDVVASLNAAYSAWATQLEYQFAHRLIRGEAHLSEYPFYERFAGLVTCELAMVANSHPDRILFIGSGPLPTNRCDHRLCGPGREYRGHQSAGT